MRGKFYKITGLVALLGAVSLFAPAANAQTFSSGGFNPGQTKTGTSQCADDVNDTIQVATELRNRINLILNCNKNGQVYNKNSKTCVTPTLSPEYVYTEKDSGEDTLAFYQYNTETKTSELGETVVVGGKNGQSLYCHAQCTWNGIAVDNGDSVLAYYSETVPYGDSCNTATNTETRTCVNGVLTGSFTNVSCTPDSGNCTAPWGGTVANGSSVTAYLTDSPGSGSCTEETRTCTNGTLSGSYAYNSCEPDLPDTPQPPTTDCFFWVSGYTPPYGVIGSDDDGSNIVGAGAYPDAMKPFSKANAKTFDMIAIGPKTRLVIYKDTNFKGGEYIDIHGPKVIGNKCLPAANYPRGWKTNPTPRLASSSPDHNGTNALSIKSTIYGSMFPTNTRVEYDMNRTSVGCYSGKPPSAPYSRYDLMWGGGSLKVYCDRGN